LVAVVVVGLLRLRCCVVRFVVVVVVTFTCICCCWLLRCCFVVVVGLVTFGLLLLLFYVVVDLVTFVTLFGYLVTHCYVCSLVGCWLVVVTLVTLHPRWFGFVALYVLRYVLRLLRCVCALRYVAGYALCARLRSTRLRFTFVGWLVVRWFTFTHTFALLRFPRWYGLRLRSLHWFVGLVVGWLYIHSYSFVYVILVGWLHGCWLFWLLVTVTLVTFTHFGYVRLRLFAFTLLLRFALHPLLLLRLRWVILVCFWLFTRFVRLRLLHTPLVGWLVVVVDVYRLVAFTLLLVGFVGCVYVWLVTRVWLRCCGCCCYVVTFVYVYGLRCCCTLLVGLRLYLYVYVGCCVVVTLFCCVYTRLVGYVLLVWLFGWLRCWLQLRLRLVVWFRLRLHLLVVVLPLPGWLRLFTLTFGWFGWRCLFDWLLVVTFVVHVYVCGWLFVTRLVGFTLRLFAFTFVVTLFTHVCVVGYVCCWLVTLRYVYGWLPHLVGWFGWLVTLRLQIYVWLRFTHTRLVGCYGYVWLRLFTFCGCCLHLYTLALRFPVGYVVTFGLVTFGLYVYVAFTFTGCLRLLVTLVTLYVTLRCCFALPLGWFTVTFTFTFTLRLHGCVWLLLRLLGYAWLRWLVGCLGYVYGCYVVTRYVWLRLVARWFVGYGWLRLRCYVGYVGWLRCWLGLRWLHVYGCYGCCVYVLLRCVDVYVYAFGYRCVCVWLRLRCYRLLVTLVVAFTFTVVYGFCWLRYVYTLRCCLVTFTFTLVCYGCHGLRLRLHVCRLLLRLRSVVYILYGLRLHLRLHLRLRFTVAVWLHTGWLLLTFGWLFTLVTLLPVWLRCWLVDLHILR